jgi:hypothetical protein
VRILVEHAQLEAVGEIVGCRVDADRAAVGTQCRLDGGQFGEDVGDGLAARQGEPGPPAPYVDHGGQHP